MPPPLLMSHRSLQHRGGAVPGVGGGILMLRVLHAINVAVYMLWRVEPLHAWMLRHFTLTQTSAIAQGRWWTLLTPCFSHADSAHLAGNLAFLEAFGRPLAALLGGPRFAALYAAAGLAAHAAWLATVGALRRPRRGGGAAPRRAGARREEWACRACTLINRPAAAACTVCGAPGPAAGGGAAAGGSAPETHSLGASGSVSGVITCAGLLFPFLAVRAGRDGVPELSVGAGAGGTPLLVFGVGYLLREFVVDRGQALGVAAQDGVGHAAHWGGALFGAAVGVALRALLRLPLPPARQLLRLLWLYRDSIADGGM